MYKSSLVNTLSNISIKEKLKDIETNSYSLTQGQIEFIEQSTILRASEKYQILLMHLHYRFLHEIEATGREAVTNGTDFEKEYPDKIIKADRTKISVIQYFVSMLPFPTTFYVEYDNRIKDGYLAEVYYIHICANERVKHILEKDANTLTSDTYGLLYGYPETAILARHGFLEEYQYKEKEPHSIYKFMGGAGRSSKLYFEQEEAHYIKQWEAVKAISPKIIEQCEEQYKKHLEI